MVTYVVEKYTASFNFGFKDFFEESYLSQKEVKDMKIRAKILLQDEEKEDG